MSMLVSWQANTLNAALVAGALAVLPWAQPALGEESAPAPMLEEIVVTAQRRSESIQDVPLSVAAYSGEELAAMRIQDTPDLAHFVPGFTASRTFLDIPVNTIRGVGFNAINVSSTSSVGVYLDEVSHAFPYMAKDLIFDIERVEVLKGPQGTLFGRNTTGGLVNYVAAKPTPEFEASLSGTLGNFETFDTEGYVSGPLGETISGRLAFRRQRSSEGWQHSVTHDGRHGEVEKLAVRGTLEFAPNDRLDARLTGNYWRDESETAAAQLVDFRPSAGSAAFADPNVVNSLPRSVDSQAADWDLPSHQPFPSPANHPNGELFALVRPEPEEDDTDFHSVALQVRFGLTESTDLISLTSYQRVSRDNGYDADGSAREIGTFETDSRVSSLQQEVRLLGEHDRGSWTVGAYYSQDDMDDFNAGWFGDNSQVGLLRFIGAVLVPDLTDAGMLPAPVPFPIDEISAGLRTNGNQSEQEGEGISVFAHGEYLVSESLTVSGGVRYTENELEFEGCSRDWSGTFRALADVSLGLVFGNYPLGIVPFGCTTVTSDTFEPVLVRDDLKEDNVSGRLSLEWRPAEEWMVYGSVSRGFKAGVFTVISANLDSQLEPATQEKLIAYELGVKGDLGRLRVNASAYHYDFEDKQIFAQVADPVFTALERIVNVPESQVQGAEVGAYWQATARAWLSFNAAYTDTEIEDFSAFDEFGTPTDFSGNEFTYTPNWELGAGAGYDFSLPNGLALLARIDAGWQSETQGSFADLPGFEIEDYAIVNSSMTLRGADENWTAAVWVENLFDETYWHSTAVRIENVVRYMGMPRTYGVTLAYRLQ